MILSVITGTYNRLPHLQKMMESARKSLPPNFVAGREYEFVVADGGSTDGTLEWLREQPGVTLIEQGELLGAIKAFNAAGAAAQGDYVCPANDDIEFVDKTLAKGLAYMMDNPGVGAGCFLQDRNMREWHVEEMPILHADGSQTSTPYMQVGLTPRWLWDHCGGWGDWGGHTYGGDNYLSGKVLEAGYKIVPIEGCRIHDRTVNDGLRRINAQEAQRINFWDKFRFQVNETPQVANPLPERKRVLYAPIIERGYDIQKQLKRGLREALGALGTVWEVDHIYGEESIVEAGKAWNPHFVVCQLHTAADMLPQEAKELRAQCQEWMVSWGGDVWSDQATPEMMETLRHFDLRLTVNASLLPKYEEQGILARYWQNSGEPALMEPAPDFIPKKHDVVFLGNNYSSYRMNLALRLKGMAENVGIYGRGYVDEAGNPVLVDGEPLSSGESLYDFRKTGALYRAAKIMVGDNQYMEATGFASDRLFMGLLSGGCMVMHQRVEGSEQYMGLIPGVHYVEWVDLDDLQAKIAYYLTHDEERRQIAACGTYEARLHHTYAARVLELQELVKVIPKTRNTISACLIVKNEAHNIAVVLEQLLTFADEIVVVDTGSTDGTSEWLGSEASAKVLLYQFPWNANFSEARNFAKSKCTKEWIFWMDADDRIDPETLVRLKKAWPWKWRARGITNPMAIQMLYRDDAQACMQTRLFRNIPKVEWRGRAMETVDESLAEIGIKPVAAQREVIWHQGEKDPEKRQAKLARYVEMLKLDPPSAQRSFNIGMCYAAMGRHGDAFLWFRTVEETCPGSQARDFVLFGMGYSAFHAGFTDLAMECLEKSAFPDAYYLRFTILQEAGRQEFDLLQRFVDLGMDPVYPSFCVGWRDEAVALLGRWHRQQADILEHSLG